MSSKNMGGIKKKFEHFLVICAVFLLFFIFFFRVYIQNKSGKCVGVFLQFQVFLSTEVIRYIELQITYITVSHLKALFCWLIPHDVNKIISWWFQIKKKIRRLNYENNFGFFWGAGYEDHLYFHSYVIADVYWSFGWNCKNQGPV